MSTDGGGGTAGEVVSARFDDLVDGVAFTLTDPIEMLTCSRAADVPETLRRVEAAARQGHHVAGFVSYEASAGLGGGLRVAGWPVGHFLEHLPLAWFGVFADRRPVAPLRFDVDANPSDQTPPWQLERSRQWHQRVVDVIRAGIAAGDYYQVNLTAPLATDGTDDPFALYTQMALAQRGRYNAFIRTEEFDISSCSPELFFDITDSTITTRPMKGTARRGRWPDEDEAAAAALRSSAKDRAENVMIVDLLRNDLARIAQVGTVAVPALLTV